MRKKSDLPTKTCAACGRPMVWRKKWKQVWDEVRYCSERCRRIKAQEPSDRTKAERAGDRPVA